MATTEEKKALSASFEEEIAKLMGKGHVHFVCNEIMDAVKCFEEATKKLDNKYGQAHDKCGEAYLCYGKSLLELARMEGGVIGHCLQGVVDEKENVKENGHDDDDAGTSEEKPALKEAEQDKSDDKKTDDKKTDDLIVGPPISEIDEEEKEDIGVQVQDAMTVEALDEAMKTDSKKSDGGETLEEMDVDNKATVTKEPSAEELDKDGKTTGEKASSGEGEGSAEAAGEGADDGADEGEDEGMDEGDDDGEGDEDAAKEQEPAEEDELTYMELAWQIIEVARLIFEKRGKLQMAQCHLKLGEIQMEQEQFMGAIDDFLKCLDVQTKYLEKDDRLIAETAYNIGLSFSFQSMHGKAKTYYNQALSVLDNRMKSLQKLIDEADSKGKGKGKAKDDDPVVASRKELEELKDLYPEIKAKVDEASDLMTQTQPNVASIMSNGATTTVGFGEGSGDSSKSATKMAATLIPVKKGKKASEPASDITHLLHRNKRKQDDGSAETPDEEACPVKKPRQEVSNGKPEAAKPEATAT